MSLNIYDKAAGTLRTIANGSTVWQGTKAQFEAQKDSIPNNTTIIIVDDYSDSGLRHPDYDNATLLTTLTFSSSALQEYTWTVEEDCYIQCRAEGVTNVSISGNQIYVNGQRVMYSDFWTPIMPVKKGDVVRIRLVLSGTSSSAKGEIYKYPFR